ncbi:protein kinase 4-like [Venturia canescens]|uniref:protein kinase 4-like n=1 Tax=Venturia canescens TaxID=32260 RepID=UPI001C9CDEEE|nr:protein kinase 4-like [Venturia canescens]XP_043285152.1 protein kinase 4-like [Venturia canescens]
MAPDRPDATGIEAACGLTVTRVLSFGETVFTVKEGDNASTFTDSGSADEQMNEEQVVGMANSSANGSTNDSIKSSQPDDDLTSLSWLHQQNLLKGLEISSPAKSAKNDNHINNNNNNNTSNNNNNSNTNNNNVCEDSAEFSENTNSISSLDDSYFPDSNGKSSNASSTSRGQTQTSHIYQSPGKSFEKSGSQFVQEAAKQGHGHYSTAQSNQAKISLNNNILPVSNRNKHPTHIPYDPHLHRNSKPPYSFSCLIFMAIEDSPVKALPVKEVYAWILDHFPYFRNAPTGWKNSVRHNLSLNKCFRKVEKAPNLGKGSLWMVDAQYRPNLIQALSRAPFPPPSAQNLSSPEKTPRKSTSTRLPDPVLFPYLSKRLASSNIGDNSELEFDSDVDAAAVAMLSFKHGPIILNHNKDRKKKVAEPEKLVPVITRSSSEDHTYSCITSVKLDSKRPSAGMALPDVDEQRKIAEGADALLNLAGVSTNLSHSGVHNEVENSTTPGPTSPTSPTITASSSSPLTSKSALPVKTKRRSSSSDFSSLGDKRRRRWREWGEGNRYLKQVRG